MHTPSLTPRQRDILSLAALVAPAVALATTASATDGAFLRAGKVGAVCGLVGSFGVGTYALLKSSKESEQLGNTLVGSLLGAAGAGIAGVVGSLASDSIRSIAS